MPGNAPHHITSCAHGWRRERVSTIDSDNIENFSHNPFRRVELKCQLVGDADHVAAMELLRARMASIPNVVTTPAPDVEILVFNLVGPVLAVRPFCHTDHYWQVYFDGNRAIRESLAAAGFPSPTPSQLVFTRAGSAGTSFAITGSHFGTTASFCQSCSPFGSAIVGACSRRSQHTISTRIRLC